MVRWISKGLDVDGDRLWVCGSHSLARGKAEDGDDIVDALSELAAIDRDPNRAFLDRIRLCETPEDPQPVDKDGERAASTLKLFEDRSILKHWPRKDEIPAPFLDLPCRENGFDIEGVAATGLRVWIGLRGPVIGTSLNFNSRSTAQGN